MNNPPKDTDNTATTDQSDQESAFGENGAKKKPAQPAKEFGGRGGPDPTRYDDWEINGKCVDF